MLQLRQEDWIVVCTLVENDDVLVIAVYSMIYACNLSRRDLVHRRFGWRDHAHLTATYRKATIGTCEIRSCGCIATNHCTIIQWCRRGPGYTLCVGLAKDRRWQ